MWGEDHPLLLDAQGADEKGREVPELVDVPPSEAEIFTVATVDSVRSLQRLSQAAEGDRVVRAASGLVGEWVRKGPVPAAVRPVPPKR